jgi:hypothetical protein
MKIFFLILPILFGLVFIFSACTQPSSVPPIIIETQIVDKEVIQTHEVDKVVYVTSTPAPPIIPPDENFPGLIGWEADKDGVIAYYNGSFYVRDGKETCYGFGIYNSPQTLKWYNNEGYLPALVTEFERDNATIQVINFADKVTLNRRDYVVVYSRVAVSNHGKDAVNLAPAPSQGLVALTQTGLTVQPGQTANHDYAVAADRFGKNYRWPSDEDLAAAGGWDEHYTHMKDYWNYRLSGIVNITRLPDERLINAYKAGFIYTHIIRDGDDIHVGENGYDMVFDHDSLGILTTLFTLGDYTYARPLLDALQAQLQYDDARYKNSWVWALYLMKTGDVDFVQKHFNDIKSNTHQIEKDLTGPGGIVKMTNDIDANGYWTIDDAAALFGLTTYQYLTNRLGKANETEWAKRLYDRLLTAVNNTLQQTMNNSGIDYLPCALTEPNDDNRCREPKDANWASMLLFGRWYWEGYLWGADQHGPMLDSINATYTYGFDRLKDILPAHTYGGYPGYSTGYNAGYGRSGLRGTQYRAEAIEDYLFMLDNTQSSPFGWWENIGDPGTTPWEGNHPSNGGGACPHMWGQSFATAGLLDSLIVEKSDGTVLVGRGIPNDWIAEGQVIELSNYPLSNNKRIGIKVEGMSGNQVKLSLTGDMPDGKVVFNLPIFIENIRTSSAGEVDNDSGTVTLDSTTTSVTVEFASSTGSP